MWGGRFAQGPASVMKDITPSIDFDKRLAVQDLAGSRAHARMLAAQGIISQADGDAILAGLDAIEKEIADGTFVFKRELEDIHLNIEARLKEIAGEAAGRLHTARSRNDQVATDFRLWVRDACAQRAMLASTICSARCWRRPNGMRKPSCRASPICSPRSRSPSRIIAWPMSRCWRATADASPMRAMRLNESPLGAAALAGTSFPIDREATAKELGFAHPMRNSLDAVSARDFALEYLAAATICMTNLSRLAGELVQWTSPAFGFVRLSDAFTTGSSIMPQKRNPDAAELVRGKTGRVLGDFVALATVVKGLALAYGSDLQEDKERVFDAADTLDLSLARDDRHDRRSDRPIRTRCAARRKRAIRPRPIWPTGWCAC